MDGASNLLGYKPRKRSKPLPSPAGKGDHVVVDEEIIT